MVTVVNKNDLPGSTKSWQFEGYLHQDVNVSFFVNETLPGRRPSLHKHPYPEIFVILDGQLTCTVGDNSFEETIGQVMILPADTLHKFIHSGVDVARHVDIYTSAQMVKTWLEQWVSKGDKLGVRTFCSTQWR